MAYNEKLADRIREALADLPDVVEKKMFRGVTFMVNGKMCISVGDDEIMCRIDPADYEMVLDRNDTRQMIHGGRVMKGWIFVGEEGAKTKKDLDFWITLCLAYNEDAKASKRSKKK